MRASPASSIKIWKWQWEYLLSINTLRHQYVKAGRNNSPLDHLRHSQALRGFFIFHQHSDLYRQVEEILNYLILGFKQNPNISWGRGKREEVILDRFEHSLTYNLHTTWVSFIWEKYDHSDVTDIPGLSSIQSDISLTFQLTNFFTLKLFSTLIQESNYFMTH